MATPPTRVSYNTPASGNYSATGTTQVTASFAVLAGDLLVVLASGEQATGSTAPTAPSASGGSVTWTQRALQPGTSVNTQSVAVCWTGVVGTSATITVTCPRPMSSVVRWGFSAAVYRDHGGVGVAFSGSNGTGSTAPSVAASCSANSAVVCQINDWNAADGTSRTWRTINGVAASESVYFRDASAHTVYGGHRADTGAAGSITQGLTAPTGQRWVLVGVEILGASAASNTGTVAGTLPKATGAVTGTAANPATLAATAPVVTGSIAGQSTDPGTVTAALPRVVGSVAGSSTNPGTVVGTLARVTGSIAGSAINSGTVAGALPKVAGSLTDTTTIAGTLSATLPKVAAAVTGTATNAGTLTAALPAPSGSIVGQSVNTGTLSASLAPVTGSIAAGGPVVTGTVAAPLSALVGSIFGASVDPGALRDITVAAAVVARSWSAAGSPPTRAASPVDDRPTATPTRTWRTP